MLWQVGALHRSPRFPRWGDVPCPQPGRYPQLRAPSRGRIPFSAATSCIVLWMLLRATGSRPWDTAANISNSRARRAKCGFATCPTTYWAQTWRPAATHRWCSGMALYLASREQTTPPVRLRVHAGGPEPPPLGANSAVATTSTSPSPALAHPRPLARPCPLAPVPPCRPVVLFPSLPPYPRFSFALSPTPWHTSSAYNHVNETTDERIPSGIHPGTRPCNGPCAGGDEGPSN